MSAIVREVTIGDCRLIQGDCLEVMPLLGKVNMVCTSPPYDNLREYGKDFDGVDCLAVISQIAKSLVPGGVCMWNVADATVNGSETGTSFKQALHAMECGMRLHDTMIYAKSTSNFPDAIRYYSAFEYMFIFSLGAPKTFNPIEDKPNKWAGDLIHGTDRKADGKTKKKACHGQPIKKVGRRLNWWNFDNRNQDSGHPAPMPYKMAHDQIISWTEHGEIVLDPFMGSGTTLVACAKLGRKGIGIKLDPDYFDIACERVRKAYAQPDLFIAPPSPPKQEDMGL